MGTSKKATAQRDRMTRVIEGIYQTVTAGADLLDDLLDDDLILKGRAYLRITPDPAAWGQLAGPQLEAAIIGHGDGGGDDDDARPTVPTLEAARTIDDAVALASARLEALDVIAAAAEAAKEAQEQVTRRRIPFRVEWVPARNVVAYRDRNGALREVWEWQQWTVADFLAAYVDQDGNPLAKRLASAASFRGPLTQRDTCTVVIRSDSTHIQIAVVDMHLTAGPADRWEQPVWGEPEWVWTAEHGMGEPPYAYFPGRQTTAAEPSQRYHGAFDGVVHLCVLYDELLSQLYAVTREAAFGYQYLEQDYPPQGQTAGDRPPKISFVEGEVYTGLPPGARIRPVAQTTPSDMALLDRLAGAIQAKIDLATLTPVSSGAPAGADSGYMYGQMSAASETTLEAARRGKGKGWAHAARLFIKAARVLHRWGCGPIPIRHVGEEGVSDVVLDEELAAHDWQITASVRGKPVGGEYALTNTLVAQLDKGIIDMQIVRDRLGYRDGQQIDIRRLADATLNSPQFLQMLGGVVLQQALSELQHQAAPALPEQPIVPPALAELLAKAGGEAAARLPGGWQGLGPVVPGMASAGGAGGLGAGMGALGPEGLAAGGMGGLPNLAGQMTPLGGAPPGAAPSLASLLERMTPAGLGERPGGTPPGMPSLVPGGYNRQSELLGLRG
jgi:hypothetical protein